MKIQIAAFGKLKTPGLRDAADYYIRNLQPWCETTETELKPISVPDKSPATRLKIQSQEQERLLETIPKTRSALILLDETGKAMTTQGWVELFKSLQSQSMQTAVFAIGSSLGHSDQVKAVAKFKVSLGPQTLSHELARVVLLEQLYRAWSVIQGHPYHNEG
jgi:23S rRNA (pseudouridine1915-N3)-methyltransferase